MSNNKSKILTELPRYTEGTHKGKVNCQAMVGMKLELEYKQNIYIVEIIDCIKGNKPRFKIEYNGEIKEIQCGNFVAGKFGGILNKITKSFKCEIGDEIKDEEGRDIVIIDKEYRIKERTNGKWVKVKNEKWYNYRCNKCRFSDGSFFENWIEEGNLLKGKGCPCCSNRTVVEDINSIWATDRWMCDLGLSEQDAKTHTRSSGDKVFVVCPKCNKKKEIRISVMYRYKSIGCTCGDGFSYGHKYVYSMLKQNNIRFEDNVTFNWCKFKDFKTDKVKKGEYDFVIEDIKVIVEVDGSFHRKDNEMNGQTKEESQYIDDMKDKLAKQNGYEVIRVYYNDDFKIKDNLLKSDIVKIINLNNIDWEECERFALSNRVIEICKYWNDKKENETTADLELIFKINKDTIIRYLKKGTELGWCNYNAKEELEKSGRRSTKGKVVAMYDLEGNFIMKENSTVKLKERCLKELNINLDTKCISGVCLGKCKTHKGYIFKYID